MLAIIGSLALHGLEGRELRVEVDVANGLPAFNIVGLPDEAVREARERVRAAIKNSGFDFPARRITVNLAPGDIKKEGTAYDLPIALGVLAACGVISAEKLQQIIALGELSLEGEVRPISGVLPMALALQDLRPQAILFAPTGNGAEAALARKLEVRLVENLKQVVQALHHEIELPRAQVNDQGILNDGGLLAGPDLADVRGQTAAKRGLEVAAAGGHNLLLIGSPGTGKTLLARCLPSILPDLSEAEALEVTKIYSVAGLLPSGQGLIRRRPFRAPHHTASTASIIGGGRIPKPGEVSLASYGVLFLDELPEYHRDVLEALRQPLEDRVVTVSRVAAAITYPANFMLVGTMNPCPCGFLGDPAKECRCTPHQVMLYRKRLSGPLLDRIDLQIEVPRLEYSEVEKAPPGEASETVRLRVMAARERQQERLRGEGLSCNAEMQTQQVRRYCLLSKGARQLLRAAFHQLRLSMRAHDRLLKMGRTIADLEGAEVVEEHHLAEAIQYRPLDREG